MKVNINAQLRHLPLGENRVQESANPENFQSEAKLSSERGKGGGGGGDATKDGRGRRKHNRLANEEEREMRPESSTR